MFLFPDSSISNFQLSFSSKTVSDYVRFDLLSSVPPLAAFTACLWIKGGDQSDYGALFSYSVRSNDNEILVDGYSSLKFMVNTFCVSFFQSPSPLPPPPPPPPTHRKEKLKTSTSLSRVVLSRAYVVTALIDKKIQVLC